MGGEFRPSIDLSDIAAPLLNEAVRTSFLAGHKFWQGFDEYIFAPPASGGPRPRCVVAKCVAILLRTDKEILFTSITNVGRTNAVAGMQIRVDFVEGIKFLPQ
jgi:hypothetical protein